ncbi:MAG: hypothetical protein AB7G08_23920 [Hyphomicrobiaceae bacterium]
MNVHFLTHTERGYRLVRTLIDPTPDQVEAVRAELAEKHATVATWATADSNEAALARLKQRGRK